MYKKNRVWSTVSLLLFISIFFVLPGIVFATDVTIQSDGSIETGISNTLGNLKVIGGSGEHAIGGVSSGTGVAGIYGINTDTSNYGGIGTSSFGVYGNSVSGYAGYFAGDVTVTGNLIVDGFITGTGGDHDHDEAYPPIVHIHSGDDITGGTILDIYIDPGITRDNEVMSIVLANDGSGSGLDADKLDGIDSSGFSDALHGHTTLETRLSTLESEEAKSFITRSARAVSDRAYIAEPELENWIKAVQKGGYMHPMRLLTEVDTNGDGVITAGTDFNNLNLSTVGVVTTFIQSRNAMDEDSPFNDAIPLWVNGGPVVNQPACNAVASNNSGQITLCYTPAEDYRITNIFVSASDNNSPANLLYSKSVTGVSDISRRADIIESAEEEVSELEKWIAAVKKGGAGHLQRLFTEVDMDGDGTVEPTETNLALATVGVVTQFIAKQTYIGLVSPWDASNELWRNGGAVAEQAACDTVAAANEGHITLCYEVTGGESTGIQMLYISTSDNSGNVVYSKLLTVTSDIAQIRDAFIESAKEEVPELEKWVKAVQKGGIYNSQRLFNDVDMDGDGTVDADETNLLLAVNGMVTQWMVAQTNIGLVSPWDSGDPLWVYGGAVAEQEHCDTVAVANPGQITLCYEGSGGEGAGIKVLYISASDNSSTPVNVYSKSIAFHYDVQRRDAIVELAKEEVSELEKWMAAVRKASTPDGTLTEVDTNGDGVVAPGGDMTNNDLAVVGMVNVFIGSRMIMEQISPWNHDDLWADGGGAVNQPACNLAAQANPGQITLCYNPFQDETIEYIFISVSDNNSTPNLIYTKTISAN